MNQDDKNMPRIMMIARQIEQDIARRKLKSGDRYLNAGEVATMLRISKHSANRALQLLAQRRILDRKQCRGTHVANPKQVDHNALITSVCLWMQHFPPPVERWPYDEIILGLNRVLPGVHVQIQYVPSQDEREFCDKAIRRCLAMEQSVGLILNKASLTVQRIVQDSGLPAVIHGTPQSCITRLPSVDRDQFQMGWLLAERVLRKHERLLVFTRELIMPGDHLFLDGVAKYCCQVGLDADAVLVRSMPQDVEAVQAEVLTIMQESGPRRGIIARDEMMVQGAVKALRQLKLTPGKQVLIAMAVVGLDSRLVNKRQPPFPYIRLQHNEFDQGEMLGRMLLETAEHPYQTPQHIRLPVEVVEPPTARGRSS